MQPSFENEGGDLLTWAEMLGKTIFPAANLGGVGLLVKWRLFAKYPAAGDLVS